MWQIVIRAIPADPCSLHESIDLNRLEVNVGLASLQRLMRTQNLGPALLITLNSTTATRPHTARLFIRKKLPAIWRTSMPKETRLVNGR